MTHRRDLLRLAERDGWTASKTAGGHVRLTHPDASAPVFTGSTPSDHRALANARAMMRRVLPSEPKPVQPARPKRRPKPPPRQQHVEQAVEMYQPPEPPRPRRPLPGAPRLAMSRWP